MEMISYPSMKGKENVEDIIRSNAYYIREAVRSGEMSAREVVETFLEVYRRMDGEIRAYLHVDEESALAAAEEVDAAVAKGKDPGRLAGVPVAVKDNICTKGMPTTCASRILEGFVPPYSATVIERIVNEGGIVLGKTNLDEFAMGSSCENSAFGPTKNPVDRGRVPGGSSGGSAAAVASGEAVCALGSDTGGSVRQPAAFCGVVGLKPTYGRVSRYGLVAFASSLDQIGPITRTVRDAALLLEVMAGKDPLDSTSADEEVPEYTREMETALKDGNVTVGVPREFFDEGLDPETEEVVTGTIEEMKKNGVKVVDISLQYTPYAVATYYVIATAEASSNLARYDGVHYGYRTADFKDIVEMYSRTRREGFGDEVKRRIMMGTFVLSSGYYDAYFLHAQKVRRLIKDEFDRVFASRVDFVVGPTTPTPAFKLGEKVDDPLAMYLSDVYTISANLAGIPAISVPCGRTAEGLPVGFQIMGPAFSESRLLALAHMVEEIAG